MNHHGIWIFKDRVTEIIRGKKIIIRLTLWWKSVIASNMFAANAVGDTYPFCARSITTKSLSRRTTTAYGS